MRGVHRSHKLRSGGLYRCPAGRWPGEMEGRVLGLGAQFLGEQIGDVVGNEGIETQKILDESADQLFATEFSQGDVALNLHHGIGVTLSEHVPVGRCGRPQLQETHELRLLVGAQALGQQDVHLAGLFEVLPPIVAAPVLGDRPMPV